ncbi:MAG TPA: hemolysin family protein, partial [Blastocatellia bacterium]|nr:hemolysin family protein [Blastocatellia bacterium]
ALVIARPIELFCRVFRPLISFLNLSSVLPLRMLGLQPAFVNRLVYSPEELRHIISTSHKGGFLTDHERRMIQNMFDFTGKVVREVMVPRPEVAAIESTLDLRAAVSSFIDNGYSRMPVYEGRIDNIAGVVHSKDLMAHFPASGSFDLKAIARKPLFVPDTASLSEALAQMQSSKSHFGIVVDEHGGFEGIVTLEDLLEEIVGEIEDEYDEGENLDLVRTEPDGSLTVAGSITVRDANSLLKLGIPESDDYATLAGFLLSRAGKILSKGDHVDFDSAIFAIEQVERRRVVRIRITRPAGPKSPADAETSSESPASVVATD